MNDTPITGQTFQIGAQLHGVCTAWYFRGRGFGYLKVDGYATALFVPGANLRRVSCLRRGERVSFEVRLGNSGRLQAADVELL